MQKHLNFSKSNLIFLGFLAFCLVELFTIKALVDLPVGLWNFLPKAQELANGQIPSSNYYGPGSALMLLPFLWDGPSYFIAVVFYFTMGVICYWKICAYISNTKFRAVALAALPLNVYLFSLSITGNDTVYEFFLLQLIVLAFIKNIFWLQVSAGLLLATSRSQYWALILLTSVVVIAFSWAKNRKFQGKYLVPLVMYFSLAVFNLYQYGSPSPSLQGGITTYDAYSKYYYLSHPKYDMDAFLAETEHPLPEIVERQLNNTPMTEVEMDRAYYAAAISSAIANPKEVILGLFQKIDSYFFAVQKIPNLPGEYVLNAEKKQIEIRDERKSWPLVVGHIVYQTYRSLWLMLGIMALGFLFLRRRKYEIDKRLYYLAAPWVCGAIAGILYYTETRYKIVPEMILVPLIATIWSEEKRISQTTST